MVEYIPGTTAPVPAYDAGRAAADAAPLPMPKLPVAILTITPAAPRRFAWGIWLTLAAHAGFATLAMLILLTGHIWPGMELLAGLILWLCAESLYWDVWLQRSGWRWRLPWHARHAVRLALVAAMLGMLTGVILNRNGLFGQPAARDVASLFTFAQSPADELQPHIIHLKPGNGAGPVALAPDGSRIAVGAATGVAIWDSAGSRILRELQIAMPSGAQLALQSLAWSPDNASLAASYQIHTSTNSDQAAVTVWDAKSGAAHFTSDLNGPAYSLAWSQNSATVAGYLPPATPTALGVVLRWDGRTGEMAQPIFAAGLPESANGEQVFAWSPLGDALAVIDHGDAVDIVATQYAQVIEQLPGMHALQSVAWSPDGAYLATGQAGGAVTLWNAVTLTPVGAVPTPLASVRDLLWSPSGADLLGAGSEQIALIHVASRQLTRVLTSATNTGAPIIAHTPPLPVGKAASSLTTNLTGGADVQAVAWSANSQAIGALFGDGAVVVWQVSG